jgi:UDP-N-acetylmuramate dehydrogenase
LKIQQNYSLLPHNTFHIDVNSRFYVEIQSHSDILALKSDPRLTSLQYHIIGDGSNLLFTEDIDGVVIRCNYDAIQIIREDDDNVYLSVGAGVEWHDLVTYTVENKFWGLENLALIPSTVGAAPVQNIGAYGAEAKDVITDVYAFNLNDGQSHVFSNSDCKFGYRTSVFKQEYLNQMLVYKVGFKLKKFDAGTANLSYKHLKDALDKNKLTPLEVYKTVIKIRQSKLPDPNKYGNAGSFFKNPIVDINHFNSLSEQYTEIPHYKISNEHYKIPAAWLIEQTGWKGKQVGRAAISENHALVIINLGNATGAEVKNLATQVQNDVEQKFGIHLEPEVQMIVNPTLERETKKII